MGLILKSLMPAYGGYTIAREEKVIFIKGAIPGEIVEVDIEEKKRSYSIARVVNIIEPSEYRDEPKCCVFGICGGCHLQFMSYEKQISMKDEVLSDSLKRLAGIEIPLTPAITDSQWNYRHRAQYKVSRDGEIGFFKESTRDLVTFESCPLMNQEINALISKIKEKDIVRHLDEIHIVSGDSLIALLKGRDYDNKLFDEWRTFKECINEHIEIGLSGTAYNDTIAFGTGYTKLDLNGFKYTVSPWTFFQSHWNLNKKIVDFITNQLMPLKDKRVLDLYAGAGNFAIPMAVHAKEVVAVEDSIHAVNDGNRNLKLNNIKNCTIVKSSAEKYRINSKFNIIIIDPPRAGLTSEVIKKILESSSDTVVYMSCNPSTLARDMKKLNEKYEVCSVRQIDFFPNTFHIEAVAFLQIG